MSSGFSDDFSLEIVEEVLVVEILPELPDVFVDTAYLQGPAGLSGALNRELLSITASGQVLFQLQALTLKPQASELFLNGAKAVYGVDYLLDQSTLAWLASAYQLDPDDVLEILYL